jgi:2-polyprenyl-3-methyl-5-hydroxy-6-metoxy-1,4-benzoquinol methylase
MTAHASTQALYFAANRGGMATYLPQHYSRVLEVGCAAGAFRQHLKQPHEYWGFEPNAEAARAASSRLDKVITGIYDDRTAAALPDKHFDLVICNDVIEHMVDHDHFLKHIKTKMQPGACIVGSIPNVRHITEKAKAARCATGPSAASRWAWWHRRWATTLTHSTRSLGFVCDCPSAPPFSRSARSAPNPALGLAKLPAR